MHCFISTDNGPHYHNSGFLFYLAEANQVFDLTLVEYKNFEAGEGKSQLDTHFAHISHKIVRWVRVGNNLETGQLWRSISAKIQYSILHCTLHNLSYTLCLSFEVALAIQLFCIQHSTLIYATFKFSLLTFNFS